jgi:hypothetical protein
MRHLVLALVACTAFAGCDNGSSSAKSGEAAGGGLPAKSETGKSEPAKASAPKHPWGSFKPGSYAKLKTVSVMEIAGNKTKSETEMKQTLLEVTADEAIVEMEMSVAGTVQKTKTTIPLKGPDGKASEGPKPRTGSEEIKVGGKSYACTWTEIESEAGGNKTVTRVWQSEDVPGHTVKSVSKTAGSMSLEATTELVESVSK